MGLVKGERHGKNGNIISPKGSNQGRTTEELSSEDFEEADLDSDEVVIEELSEGGKIEVIYPLRKV